MYSTPGLSQSQNEEAAVPPRPASNTHHPKPSTNTRKKVRDISDSFNCCTPPAQPNETPSREFYKKFYEDIKETVTKYKRKNPLQLQGSGVGNSGTQENQEKGMEDRKGHKEKEKEVNGPLRGVVVCSSRKHMDQWEEMSQVVEELGGQFLHSYGSEVTHFLFLGRSNDLNREFRKAKQDKKVIVAPDWLWMCQEKGMRVDELLFPHTHNPNMSLPMVGGVMSPTKKSRTKRKHPDREEDVEEEAPQQQELTESSDESKQKDGTQQEKEKLSKQLEEIGALAQMSGKRSGSGRGRNKPLREWRRPGTSRHVDIETQPSGYMTLTPSNTSLSLFHVYFL